MYLGLCSLNIVCRIVYACIYINKTRNEVKCLLALRVLYFIYSIAWSDHNQAFLNQACPGRSVRLVS